MLEGLFERIGPHLGVDALFNYVSEEGGGSLRLAACFGVPGGLARSMERLELGQSVCGTAALERRSITATHIQQSADPKADFVRSLGFRCYTCNVIAVDDRLIGTLGFGSRTRDEFDADELEFLETVTHHVTLAYERLRLIGELQAGDRRKDEFLATLAHELRNPLAPIRMGLEILRIGGDDRATRGKMLGTMEGQVRHMVRLIDDLLDVSRISRGKLELRTTRVDLREVARTAVDAVRPMLLEAGHALTVELPGEPLPLEGDPVRLSQVLSNLLNNAVKYTPEGGRIALAAERQGSDVAVSVRDDGLGIPEEMLQRVFEMFTQVSRTLERSHGGLGIGLHLVERIVRMHGGSVEAKSEGAGRGSEFIVRLPAAELHDHGNNAPADDAMQPQLQNSRILVVDDHVDTALSLVRLLRARDNTVEVAHEGEGALRAAETFRPDIVLLDLGLPGIDGYEVAAQLRAREASGNRAMIIAISGYGQEDDRRRSAEVGIDHHLVKPVSFAQLETLLASSAPDEPRTS